MATNTITTEQVREAIEQLAAMVAAGSISPQTVADILEMMRNLNDQEREKVIATAEAYIAEIQNTGLPAENVSYGESDVKKELDKIPTYVQSACNEVETYDSIVYKDYIYFNTGATYGSTGGSGLAIFNDVYSTIHVRAGMHNVSASSPFAVIAFFDSETISEDSYMQEASVVGIEGVHEYDAIIPEGCVLIVICNHTATLASPVVKVFEKAKTDAIKQDITHIKQSINNVSNINGVYNKWSFIGSANSSFDKVSLLTFTKGTYFQLFIKISNDAESYSPDSTTAIFAIYNGNTLVKKWLPSSIADLKNGVTVVFDEKFDGVLYCADRLSGNIDIVITCQSDVYGYNIIDGSVTENKMGRNDTIKSNTLAGTGLCTISYILSSYGELNYSDVFHITNGGSKMYEIEYQTTGTVSSLASSGSAILAMKINDTLLSDHILRHEDLANINGYKFLVTLNNGDIISIGDRLSGSPINVIIRERKYDDSLSTNSPIKVVLGNSDADVYDDSGYVETNGNINPNSTNNEYFIFKVSNAVKVKATIVGSTGVSVIAFYNSLTPSSSSLISNVIGDGSVHDYDVDVPQGTVAIGITNRHVELQTAIISIMMATDTLNGWVSKKIEGSGVSPLILTEGTYTSSNFINISNKVSTMPMVISASSYYTGTSAPTISYRVGAFTSLAYQIGSAIKTMQQWRIPPILTGMNASVTITVPSGTTLYIDNISLDYEASVCRPQYGVRMESHLGLQTYAPENTMAAYEAAAICGYPSCIVNPLATSDGVIILYHDGTQILTLDGGTTKVAFSIAEIGAMTYAQIQAYDVYKNSTMAEYFTCKVPTLEEFFALCARTGMKPTFSLHADHTEAVWLQIKSLLYKYGLNGTLTVKAPSVQALTSAYTYLGEALEALIIYIAASTLDEIQSVCNNMDNTSFAASNIVKGIQLDCPDTTAEKAAYIISRGYQASVWDVFRNLSGAQYKEYMSWGISNFTDDYNCNNGLNW